MPIITVIEKLIYDEFLQINRQKQLISIDGRDDDLGYYEEDGAYAYVHDDVIRKKLLESTFHDLREELDHFFFAKKFNGWSEEAEVTIYCGDRILISPPAVDVRFRINSWAFWSKPYSISQVMNYLKESISRYINNSITLLPSTDKTAQEGLGISVKIFDKNLSIQKELEKVYDLVEEILSDIHPATASEVNSNVLSTQFSFPDEIKIACNQYLAYFAQFLADCGINADTEIKSTVKETLFTVTPRNEAESLEKIKAALDAYLSIPSNPNFGAEAATQSDIAVIQLHANVLHLQSQLVLARGANQLAQSAMQNQQNTIQDLQLKNFQLTQSLSEAMKPKKDEEEIIKGILSVGVLEIKGMKLNMAALVRLLKRKPPPI